MITSWQLGIYTTTGGQSLPVITQTRIESFKQYVSIVERLRTNNGEAFWFRGCGNGKDELIPSLYRHRGIKKQADLELLERGLMTRFRQRSMPLVSRPSQDDWEMLFFMQHYGIPTRLLDWTESPFIAFFFAVMTSLFSRRRKKGSDAEITYKRDSTIWILNPVIWTRHALKQQSYSGGVLTPADTLLSRYKPLTKFEEMPLHPVAIYGAHNSPRIVAQRGVFTIFGHNTSAMEEMFLDQRFPARSLRKLILPKERLPEMRRSILNQGMTESVVFPDLEGLAKEMKREFGFEL